MGRTPQAALDAVRDRYTAANPRSRAAHEEAAAAMPGGNTRTTVFYPPFPLTMASAAGGHLTDVDGHTYVDLLGDYTAALYGHDNPVIRRVIDETLDAGWNLGAPGTHEARLAAELCRRFPSLDLVRFTNSGTEANLLALATATTHTGRATILVFTGAYHGSVLSFGDGPAPVNVPHRFVLGDYNDTAATNALIDDHAADLAAILVEPVLGSGGCLPATREFLSTLRQRADDTGAVLVFDEVMTSRMASGGTQELLGITPDLTTLGKYTGGGMSFGAFGGRAELMARYDPRRADALPHAGTFNNNVLSMAAGHAGLTRLLTPEACKTLFERGEDLRHDLDVLSGDAIQWTGLGSMMTAHFQRTPVTSPRDLHPTPALRDLFHLDMLHRGHHLARRGMIALNLSTTDADCTAFRAAVDAFLTEFADLPELARH